VKVYVWKRKRDTLPKKETTQRIPQKGICEDLRVIHERDQIGENVTPNKSPKGKGYPSTMSSKSRKS
jgi:hypothetical protein